MFAQIIPFMEACAPRPARGDTVTAVVRTSDKQARPYLIKF